MWSITFYYMAQNIKIGILGGGQLGKMLIQSALDLDLNIHVLDADPNCSCSQIANTFVNGDITDYETVYNFGKTLDLITIEIENVNVEALKKLEQEGKKVYPQPQVIGIIKNKITQKQFFIKHNIPTSDFVIVNNKQDVRKNIEMLPAVNKLGVGGYDGRGIAVIKSEDDLDKAFDQPGILERFVDFEKELAIIVARNESGEMKCFPLVEMVFHPVANLVEYQFSPAAVHTDIAKKADIIAKNTAEAFGITGLLAVEMFLTKEGDILVNEVAPRPHNSGHHTLKSNPVSQFDQHWRSILDLPLGTTEPFGLAAMVNLLGDPDHNGSVKVAGMDKIMEEGDIYPYFYGKKETRPFRKMGHASILATDFEKLKEKVNFVKNNLKIQAL